MSGRQWTPYQIEIILHHYCGPTRFDRWTAPAYETEVSDLVKTGVLELVPLDERTPNPDYSHLRPTEKGRVFVEMLLQTPMPRSVWLDPRTHKEVLEENVGERAIRTGIPESKWADLYKGNGGGGGAPTDLTTEEFPQ